jgi:hypothetical protein
VIIIVERKENNILDIYLYIKALLERREETIYTSSTLLRR